MADVHDKKTRSYNMSQIKCANTRPEILIRKFLFSNGIRYKLYEKKLPGKPDIVLPKYKTVIFENGCFWHGMKVVNIMFNRKPEQSSGLKKSKRTKKEMKKIY